ncbi:hypothetical protein PIB30_051823 [Stylosanthes scabra]|uniref:Uncharacterized protein n=1 Tax=Stylosanthes scabra TaxID=79078 RepID=A0ABU6WGF2_9FABA|nr:hypothetical protein [Stylosanthes scabra]
MIAGGEDSFATSNGSSCASALGGLALGGLPSSSTPPPPRPCIPPRRPPHLLACHDLLILLSIDRTQPQDNPHQAVVYPVSPGLRHVDHPAWLQQRDQADHWLRPMIDGPTKNTTANNASKD